MFVSAGWRMRGLLHGGLPVSPRSEPTLAPRVPLEVASLAGQRAHLPCFRELLCGLVAPMGECRNQTLARSP